MDGIRKCRYGYYRIIKSSGFSFKHATRVCGVEVGEVRDGTFHPNDNFGSAETQYRCKKHKEEGGIN